MAENKRNVDSKQQDLAQKEVFQTSLMDNLPCGAGIYHFKNGQMKLIYQNKIYWQLVGLNEEAYPDNSEMSAIHPDDIPIIMNELSLAIQEQRDVICEIRLRHLTMGYRIVQLLGHLVFINKDEFFVYATFSPISDIVITARQQQAQLTLLSNSIPGGIAAYEGNIDALDKIKLVYFSDGFCKLFGYTRKEYQKLANENPLGLVTPNDLNHIYKSIISLVKDGTPLDYIYRAKVNGGAIKWINVKAIMGEPKGDKLTVNAVFLAMDSDEAERLAEARAKSDELSTALSAAKQSDLAKSQFLSFMSHEIRTPLNAVMGYISIAQNEINNAKNDDERKQISMKVLDYLNKSQIASRHLLTLINDVLDMSAIESGKMKMDSSPFDFRNLISSLTIMFFNLAKTKNIKFDVQFTTPTEEWFIGDQLRVNQVLTNLLSNAIKFTPEEKSVTLTIKERYIDEKTTGFCFIISDTGIGMSQSYLKHIWTPFEQAETTISRRFGGSGLGLSITKNLVNLMGGTIEVESEPNFGSKFTVNLTFTRMEQPVSYMEVDFSTINALVVDDDRNTCDYIKLLFDRCNAKCVTYTSGKEAIEAFSIAQKEGNPYNFCLIDWRMPKMDGLETISEIKNIAQNNLPIVVVSAYDFEDITDQMHDLHINHFIAKPLFQSSLFDLLVNICGKEKNIAKEPASKLNYNNSCILLVEDNNMNMEVAKHLLSSVNLSIDVAWNGQEAVDMFTKSEPGKYSLILMDVHMPILNGYEATRTIRLSDHKDAQTIPIIAMTADAFSEDINEAHEAGMNDHIAKPIDTDILYNMLSSYIYKK